MKMSDFTEIECININRSVDELLTLRIQLEIFPCGESRLKRGSWCVIGPKVNDIMLLGHYRLSNNHMKGNWLVIHTFTKIVKQLTYIMYNVNQPLYTRLSTGVR